MAIEKWIYPLKMVIFHSYVNVYHIVIGVKRGPLALISESVNAGAPVRFSDVRIA